MRAVLIDVDDTLAATQREILTFVNDRVETPILYEELTPDHRESKAGAYSELVTEFLTKPELVAAAQPLPEAEDALARLHQAGFEIHIASARKEPLHSVTERWLLEHALADYVHHIHGRTSAEEGAEFKSRVAHSVRALAAFDDTLSVLERLHGEVEHLYLLDRPWNRAAEPEGVVRCAELGVAVEHFLAR